ncbi:uncharacterized protein LOC132752565 isoform X2 [Ruditapes philippinarum]|uniref:uncharacterized protein LOC132752565 isoform X2 n=1 Tax=Ruditapes philippinarum TaxID=129788 RepID=UPI00295BB745|nr:uncharacterized protein LOC132752565 isoform X2 [Ruditapes philippinarum]
MLHVLVFIALLGQIKVIESSCEYGHINAKYQDSCRKKEYLDELFTDLFVDGELKSEVFLEKLVTTCSNYAEYSKCANCTAKHVCYEEQDKLKEILADRWSIFCNDDQPASWLVRILHDGLNYNVSCRSTFMKTLNSCVPPQPPEESSNETSLSGLVDEYRRVGQNVFSCSMAVILKNDIINCDSSWQDILLVSWLEVSSGWGMLFYIDKEEIQTLQNMRC